MHTGSGTRYNLWKELHNTHNSSQIADHFGWKRSKAQSSITPIDKPKEKGEAEPTIQEETSHKSQNH